MAESSSDYQGAIRHLQGGNTLEIGSTGTLDQYGTQENRGTLTSTGTINNQGTLTNTGKITNSSTGQIEDQVQAVTATTTAYSAEITPRGVSTLATTTARKQVKFAIAAPQTGVHKTLIAKTSGSTGTLGYVVPSTGGVTFDTTGNRKITIPKKTDSIHLVGVSATEYRVVAKGSTGVTLGAT